MRKSLAIFMAPPVRTSRSTTASSSLGRSLGHPKNIQAAQTILLSHLDLLDPGNRQGLRERVLCATHATVFCGGYCEEVALHDPTSALWNPLERARKLQRHGHIVH